MLRLNKQFFALILLFSIICLKENYVWAISEHQLAEVQSIHTIAKVGTKAPTLYLYSTENRLVQIPIGKKPTILYAVPNYQYIDRMKKFDDIYREYNKDATFYVITLNKTEDPKKVSEKFNLSVPALFETINGSTGYMDKYNQMVPSVVIIDQEGNIRYNNTAWIDFKNLRNYVNQLIQKRAKLFPQFPIALPEKPSPAPKLLKPGDKIIRQHCLSADGAKYMLEYQGKPTVLLFWMGFSDRNLVKKSMNIMQSEYEKHSDKINFFSVNGSGDEKSTQYMTQDWDYSLPILRFTANNALRYTHTFPSIVVIDGNGVLRTFFIQSEENLEQRLDTLLISL